MGRRSQSRVNLRVHATYAEPVIDAAFGPFCDSSDSMIRRASDRDRSSIAASFPTRSLCSLDREMVLSLSRMLGLCAPVPYAVCHNPDNDSTCSDGNGW